MSNCICRFLWMEKFWTAVHSIIVTWIFLRFGQNKLIVMLIFCGKFHTSRTNTVNIHKQNVSVVFKHKETGPALINRYSCVYTGTKWKLLLIPQQEKYMYCTSIFPNSGANSKGGREDLDRLEQWHREEEINFFPITHIHLKLLLALLKKYRHLYSVPTPLSCHLSTVALTF